MTDKTKDVWINDGSHGEVEIRYLKDGEVVQCIGTQWHDDPRIASEAINFMLIHFAQEMGIKLLPMRFE